MIGSVACFFGDWERWNGEGDREGGGRGRGGV